MVGSPRRDEQVPSLSVEADAVAADEDAGEAADGVGAARVPELQRVVPPGGDELVRVQLWGSNHEILIFQVV